MGWPKSRRLLRRADYLACYSRGERCLTRHFVVFIRPDPHLPTGRVGLAVTKKSGGAVERNRFKRVLREFFRLHQALLPQADLVVTPKRGLRAARLSLDFVRRDLLPLLGSLRPKAGSESQGTLESGQRQPKRGET